MSASLIRKALWLVAILSLPVGGWGLYIRLAEGKESMAIGSYVVWGLWVAMYLYFMELAAGSHLFATMDLISGYKPFARMYRMALVAALAAVSGGFLHIWLDLGHPERIYYAYTSPSPTSVMSFMVWAYSLFAVVLLVQIALEFRRDWMGWLKKDYQTTTEKRDRRILLVLQYASIPMVLAFSGGVGALFGVQGARPYWHVGMYPIAFMVTALVTGASLMLFLAAFFMPREEAEHKALIKSLSRLVLIFLVAETLFVFADYSLGLYGGLPANVAAVIQVLTGTYWWGFWILQMLVGTVIPFVILLTPGLKRNVTAVGLSGFLVLAGFTAVRINAVLPGLTVPEIEGLRTAFVDARLSFDYFPSPVEWAVTIGITGLVGLAFLIANARFSLIKKDI